MTATAKKDIVQHLDRLSEPAQVLAGLLEDRFTCRAYLPRQVPRETINSILQMAQLTASWCNTQPWKLVVTEGEATGDFVRRLADHVAEHRDSAVSDFAFPEAYEGVYAARRRETGWQLYESVGIKKGDRVASARQSAENYRLFGAPHVAIVTTDKQQGVYGAVDAGGYVCSFMLAAQALGVATTPQAAIARFSSFVHDYFQIPSDRSILCAISFGYADHEHAANTFRTKRASLDEVVEFRDHV